MFRWFSSKQPETTAVAAADTRALSNSIELLELFGAAPTSAGVTVSPTAAMRSTPVRACVELISEAAGGLPLHVYQRGQDGARERAADHPAYGLLHDQANDWTPASALREQITRDALLHGNGFAFINRDGQGIPRELIRLRPEAMRVELDATTSEPRYTLSVDLGQRVLDRRDVLHIAAPSLDGVSGASPVQQGREAIALNLVMERHAARLFGNGARPSSILSFDNAISLEEGKNLRRALAVFSQPENAGRTMLVDRGGKFSPLTFSSVDAQFLELWQHSVVEIARIFRVPPHMIFELGRATWGNAAEMGATFLRFTLDRWLKAWQGEIRLKLIAPDDRATYYAEFLTDDLLRSDLAARAEAYGKLIAARVLNPNEVRAMENRAPYAGGDEFLNPNTTAGGAANV